LKQAYGLAANLPPADKAEVMTRIVMVAAARPTLPAAEGWINELFALGAQLGELDRDGPEAAAAKTMARISPERALELLDKIQEPHLEPEQPYRDARAEAAAAVFSAAFSGTGPAILPDLRERAQRMGATGQYPYSAWARLFPLLQNSADPELVRKVFDESVTAYFGSVPNGGAEDDFRQFFAAVWRAVPYDVAHAAAQRTIQRLRAQAADKREGTRVLRIFSAAGEADFSTPGQVRLLRFLNAVIVPMDAELADALRKSDPVLNQAALRFEAGDTMVPDVVTEANSRSVPSMPVQRSQAMVRAQYLASRDANAAIAYAKGITDPLTRSEAYGVIVTTLAAPGGDPRAARDIDLAKTIVVQAEQSAESVADAPGRLLAFGHVAQAAAAVKDDATVLQAVNFGFPTGSRLLNDAKVRGSMQRGVVVFWLQQMIGRLARVDEESALANAQKIDDAKLRALLLTDVAERWKE
jgi:hypothetical protein